MKGVLDHYEVSRLEMEWYHRPTQKIPKEAQVWDGGDWEVHLENVPFAGLSHQGNTFSTLDVRMFPKLGRETDLGAIILDVIPEVMWVNQTSEWGENVERRGSWWRWEEPLHLWSNQWRRRAKEIDTDKTGGLPKKSDDFVLDPNRGRGMEWRERHKKTKWECWG